MSSDVDIDFPDRDRALALFAHVTASMGGKLRHPTGVYVQDIPVDSLSGWAALPYEQADQYGYIKIDLINNTIYHGIRDEVHLLALMSVEPNWALFEVEEIVAMLAHIRGHFDIVKLIRPQSVEDLAVVLALIRPGKRHLIHRSRAEIDAQVWTRDGQEYGFKRSHSISYAMSIIVQLNLIVEQACGTSTT